MKKKRQREKDQEKFLYTKEQEAKLLKRLGVSRIIAVLVFYF